MEPHDRDRSTSASALARYACVTGRPRRESLEMPQPPPQEVLELLMSQAQGYAEFSLRNIGHVPPTLIAESPKGPIHFIPSSLADERTKNDFTNTARLVCIAYVVTAAVLVLESWAKTAKPGEELDSSEPPCEALDRQEVVVLLGEAVGRQQQKLLPIIRSDNGRFFGFGEFSGPKLDNLGGRFAQVMPPKKPDALAKMLAGVILQTMGLTEKLLRG